MSTQATLLAVTVTAALGTVALEAAPLPGFALAGESERILVYSRPKSHVDVAGLERSLSHVEQLLGQRFVGRLEYYQYDSREEVAFATGQYADGVTYTDLGQVHSIPRVSHHEIVHAVASQMGNPGNFFQEGLAVALADGGKWWGQPVDKVAKKLVGKARLSAFLASFNSAEPGEGYFVAGSFVSWLIKNYGIARVGEFFRSCRGANTASAFAGVFGQSLGAAGDAWAASL